jgi:hypothetical protein
LTQILNDKRCDDFILMQVDGDRSPMVALMRADLEAQAQAERVAVSEPPAPNSCLWSC